MLRPSWTRLARLQPPRRESDFGWAAECSLRVRSRLTRSRTRSQRVASERLSSACRRRTLTSPWPSVSQTGCSTSSPSWVRHTSSLLRSAARGSGVIPWDRDFEILEDDLFLLLVQRHDREAALGPTSAHALARRIRTLAEQADQRARQDRASARSVAFDLHALLPVPSDILRLGPEHPQAAGGYGRHGARRGHCDASSSRSRRTRSLPASPSTVIAGRWSSGPRTGRPGRRCRRWSPRGPGCNFASVRSMISSETPVLKLETFSGPLDLLVEQARAQAIDLATLSIREIVDQFL